MELVCGSAENLPFKSNLFDVVTLFEVIEHIPPNQVHLVVREIFRVLKKGGKVILTTPNPYNLWNRIVGKQKVSLKHYKEYTDEELLQIFEMFEPLELTGIYLPIPPLCFLQKPRYRFIYDKLILLGKIFPKKASVICYAGQKP